MLKKKNKHRSQYKALRNGQFSEKSGIFQTLLDQRLSLMRLHWPSLCCTHHQLQHRKSGTKSFKQLCSRLWLSSSCISKVIWQFTHQTQVFTTAPRFAVRATKNNQLTAGVSYNQLIVLKYTTWVSINYQHSTKSVE